MPGYLYILGFLSSIEHQITIVSPTVLYKLPAIVADVLAGFVVYHAIARRKGHKSALFAAALVLFNPAFLSNSTLWGQVDILTALGSVLSIYFYEKKPMLSAVFLALSTLVKPQAALTALVILFLHLRDKNWIHRLSKYVAVSGVVFLLGFAPFSGGQNLVLFALERLGATVSQYPYGSVNAFNFWGLWGFWQKETVGLLSQKNVGLAIFMLTNLYGIYHFVRNRTSPYLFLSILFLTNFLFFTRMHERHMLPTLLPLAIMVGMDFRFIVPFALLSFTYVLNMRYAFMWIVDNFREIFTPPLIVTFIFLNLFSLMYLLFPRIKERVFVIPSTIRKNKFKKSMALSYLNKWIHAPFTSKSTADLSFSSTKILLAIILVISLVTRMYSLSLPKTEYFDEVYHAFTARAMLNNDIRAWEWWNESPEGFAFEWTHPPLAKEIMVIGMTIFGENSFGWRAPAALFGVISTFLIFLIGKELFSKKVGLIASFVFALDGLSLVMSRIGMNDIYLITFLLASLLLYIKDKYMFSAVAFGFALSSKWSALWMLPVFVLLLILKAKKPKVSILSFFVIPPLIYVGSYIPMFMSGHSWEIFWGMQKQMWWYHTQLVATHPYTSPWWSWPLLLRPIWLYTTGNHGGMVGNIYAMGNPAVFWVGVVCVVVSLYDAIKERSKATLFLTLGYLGLFAPWALSPRIMFLYHYFPSVPLLSLITAVVIAKRPKILPFVLGGIAVVFVYFYPHWTGIPVPLELSNSYFWLPGWR